MNALNTKIIQGTYRDYYWLFGDERTAYTNLVAKSAAGKNGALYMMLADGKPAGYIALSYDTISNNILYLHTMQCMRGKGVARSLLNHAIGQKAGLYYLSVAADHPFFAAIHHLCQNLNAREMDSSVVFGTSKEKDFTNWTNFMEEKGARLCRLLEERGYEKYSFRDAPEWALNDLKESHSNYYANSLRPEAFFVHEVRGLDWDMSFLAVKKHKLAAYSLVSRPDERSVIFQHISEGKEFVGSGVIFLPFAASMGMFPVFHCNRAAYAMYENNDRANAFRRKLLTVVTSTERYYHNFVLPGTSFVR